MSSNYEHDKQVLLTKIERSNELMDLILSNTKLGLADKALVEQISKIKHKNTHFQKKLTSNEFEVAIVGLEKAGKSTFANALIAKDVLPSAPERCTFTTTRLVSGEDRAVVEFYSENEFESIFRGMLEEINYPDANNVSYKTLSQTDFENYFSSLEQSNVALYKSHVGKTDEEILDILSQKNSLILTGESKTFIGDQLEADEFKEYIKGKGKDTSKPRSVKSIEIQSSKLQAMKNIIMYDVPGFDSPTKLHIRQTEERLKSADAIILVTNVGTNPSIQGTSLNVIRNNSDEDGIALKDKLFVFGNQIDRVNNEEQIAGNEEILRSDVKKHKIGLDERIFVGSALLFLDKNHSTKFSGLDDGIDAIRHSLITYYETERFEILKRKIQSLEKELKEIFEKIVELNTIEGEINTDAERYKSEITYQESKCIENRIEIRLKNYYHDLKQNVLSERWLSKAMQSELSNEKYFQAIDEIYFDKFLRTHNDSLRLDEPFERINREMRKVLHIEYLEQYLDVINSITNDKCKMVEQDLLYCFTHAVCGDVHPTDEILDKCQSLIKSVTGSVAHHKDKFGYLIERFSRDVFDIMLAYPIASGDRACRFKQADYDMRHLDYYYSQGQGCLVNLVLTQNSTKLLSVADDLLPLTKKVMDLAARATGVKTEIEALKKVYDNFANKKMGTVLTEKFDIDELFSDHHIKTSQDKDSVIKEINKDLSNLRDVLINAAVPAADLELAFLNSVDKQIKLLISSMDSDNQYSKVFNNFCAYIATLVKKEDLENVSLQVENLKLKKKIIEQIDLF